MFDLLMFIGAIVVVAYSVGKSRRDAEIEREARERAEERAARKGRAA